MTLRHFFIHAYRSIVHGSEVGNSNSWVRQDEIMTKLHFWIYLNIGDAVQKLLYSAVVNVVGPVDEVLVDVHLS